MPFRRTPLFFASLWLPLALALVAAAASAQTWDYKAWKRDKSGQYDRNSFALGTLEVKEAGDGTATLRLALPQTDACVRSALPAKVERGDETTIVTVTDILAGCEKFRYVLRNDGSGGTREVMRGGEWRSDGFDHGLTKQK